MSIHNRNPFGDENATNAGSNNEASRGWFTKSEKQEPLPRLNSLQYGEPINAHKLAEHRSSYDNPQLITPYLGLRSRLSQIWLNKWTVLILLVLVQFLLTIGSLNDNLDHAKEKALSACTKVEDVGSAFASMPHYLSVGVNKLTASSITNAVQALTTILDMILTGIEQLILFVIHMYTDTYVCLISMVVHGGLNASAAAVEKTTDAINSGIDDLADGIGDATKDVQKVIDTIWGAVEDLNNKLDKLPFVPDSISPIHLDDKPDISGTLTDFADKVKDIDIDTNGLVGGLDALNNKIPDFDDVRNLTNQAISIPFDLIKQEINDTWGSWEFDDTVFPLAEKESLSFCSDNDTITKFFEGLYKLAYDAKIAAIVILVLLAIAVCIPMYFLEKRRWRKQIWFVDYKVNDLDYAYMYSSPHRAKVGLALSDKFAWDDGRNAKRILARWFVAYATSLPALFVLALALAGYFSCLWQGILLKAVQNEAPALAKEVGAFADQVVSTLTNVSEKWSNDTNGVITSYSDDINNDIFGKVVNATVAVNNTLNTFMREIDNGINDVFGTTVFASLAKEVVRCLLGLKVESVEKGLTWVHDHAHVSFPLLPTDIFSVGANESISSDNDLTSFLASPSSVTGDEITGAVDDVVNWLRNQIIQQALISTGLLLIYVVVVLLGMMRAVYVVMTSNKHEFIHVRKPSTPMIGKVISSPRQIPLDDLSSHHTK
ncbi:hypothetical protein F5Y18DRAFT_371183 [Xylariaceae sp. FL1019]|nr:hypothetical protein F5Y18DRAFT_371183 [Xylariaceae sp. FL1019]